MKKPSLRKIRFFRNNSYFHRMQVRLIFVIGMLLSVNISAQHQHSPPKQEPEHEEHSMQHGEDHSMQEINKTTEFLLNEAAGTAVNPESMSMAMPSKQIGQWNLMNHWYAFLNRIEQSGPRGKDQLFSVNHLMLIASHEINERSTFLVRGMFSLEPATVDERRYPLLFQTGETAFGHPIVDGQHPHDLFMELSIQYAIQLNPDTLLHFYAAPIGDPALGPVAFPHRISAQELPQATLAHHLQDSTHIAADVLTAGIKHKFLRLEFSGFHGTEPDEGRWDIDQGAINSWSTRLTLTPASNWTAQISTGRLKNPEVHQPGDIERTTASITNHTRFSSGSLATSILYGRNHKTNLDLNLTSFGVESLFQFQNNNVTGRIEVVDKDELFDDSPEVHEQLESEGKSVFRIKAVTLGYARDFNFIPGIRLGFGGNFTLYSFPSTLKPFYGDNPKGFLLYLRIGSAHHSQHSH